VKKGSRSAPAQGRGCEVVLVGHEDEDNLGLRYIAAYLERAGVPVELAPYRTGMREEVLALLRARRPRLVGFSLIFQGMLPDFAELIAFLRRGGITAHFTMGGHFPTLACERTLEAIPGLDSVVRHEGERTLLELVRHLGGRRWGGLPGVACRRRGRVVVNPARPLIADLDELPFPARNGFLRARGMAVASLIASRGCHYNCSFCSIRSFYGEPAGPLRRARSPANVVDEMEQLFGEHGVRVFVFKDDDLATRGARSRAWIAELCRELEARDLGRRIVWRISCRADDIDPAVLRPLARVGLSWVYVGIESGCEQGLRTFNKRYHVADAHRAVAQLRQLGLAFDYGFMLLDPSSTLESVCESVRFLDELGQPGDVSIHFTKMFPYVGTPAAAALAAEKRLVGTDAEPDYHFRDPRLDLFQGFLSRAFHDRNFGPSGLVCVSRMAAFDLELITRFRLFRRSVAAYARETRRITAEGNAVAVRAMELALAFLRARSFERALVGMAYLDRLAGAARDADLALAEELSNVMHSNGFELPRKTE
jgi:anaerobic magnesium-protoporphyrin IX monomethyl ester cyclase